MKDRITIDINVWDAGGLAVALQKEIDSTERHLRVVSPVGEPNAVDDRNVYLAQLKNALAAVKEARAR